MPTRSTTRATPGRSSLDPARALASCIERGLRAVKKERWVSQPGRRGARGPDRSVPSAPRCCGRGGTARRAASPRPGASQFATTAGAGGPAATDTGDFIARRPQAYGADLWCLVRLQAGAAAAPDRTAGRRPGGARARRGLALPGGGGCPARHAAAVPRPPGRDRWRRHHLRLLLAASRVSPSATCNSRAGAREDARSAVLVPRATGARVMTWRRS